MENMEKWRKIDYQRFHSPLGMEIMEKVRRLSSSPPILDFSGLFSDFTPFLVPPYYPWGVRLSTGCFCSKFGGVWGWSKMASKRGMKYLFGTKLH